MYKTLFIAIALSPISWAYADQAPSSSLQRDPISSISLADLDRQAEKLHKQMGFGDMEVSTNVEPTYFEEDVESTSTLYIENKVEPIASNISAKDSEKIDN
tara:strand:+ start:247181 stop:247483 length:303 start_codon:yes stop_codon:yes gene_type:complete